MNRDKLLILRNIKKSFLLEYGLLEVLKDINLTIREGDMTAIMGPSGCGKSTLLFIVGLFLKPDSGEFFFGSEDMIALSKKKQAIFRREKMGFIFQTCDLLDDLTSYENIELPLIYAGIEKEKRKKMVISAIKQVDLEERMHHRANLLSGGERQRVAIARALVHQPKLIIADEPTGQLDKSHTHHIMDYIENIVERNNTTFILATHDREIVRRCKTCYKLEDGVLKEETN